MAQDRFSRFDVVITLVSFITLLLDVVTDLAVAVQLYVQLQLLWGSLVLGFLVVPLLVIAIVSLKWHSTDGSLTYRTLLPHACLVAPFQRYLEVLSLAYKSISMGHPRDIDAALRKQNDASILRLFGAFLESAPQLVLQLSIMSFYPTNIHPIQVWSAVSSLFSLAWALTVHCDSSRLSYQTPYVRRFLAITVHLLWQLFMVTARVTALVVFTCTFYAWICVFVGGHWVIMTACIWIKGTSFGQGRWEKVLFHVASGFIYVFVYQNIHEGRSRGRMVPYYCLAFVENGVLFSIWLIYGKPALDMKVAGAVLIFGGFLLGGLCLLVYYRWLHPSGPNHLFMVKLPSSHSQHQTAQLLKPKDNTHQQNGESLMESPPVLQNSLLELCVETETPQKGAGGAGDATFLLDSARREALVSAWQSGMDTSDSSSSSSLDADDCSLEEFNATARSSSLVLKDISQSEHTTSQSRLSSAPGRSHHTDPSAQLQSALNPAVSRRSLSGSVLPSDYSVLPDPASLCTQSQTEIEDVEMEEADNSEEGERTVVSAVQQSQGPRIQVSRPSASPEVETLPTQPLLERHPSSTPTAKPQDASSKIHLRSELSGGRLSRKKLQNTSGVVSPLVGLQLPESLIPSTPSSSEILPSRRRTDTVDRLSQTYVLGESPIVSGQGPEQSSLPGVRSGDMSFVRGSREAMAAYPESLSPESQQPKLFLGSDDIYGDRAGGESMWGISPDPSNNSSSQSREQVLSRPVSSGRVPRLVDGFDSDPDPADLRTEDLQGKHLTEEDKHEVSLKDNSVLESPDAESPTANNNDTEISWSSMNVNENEWSGLNNLKALTPDDSLCSFASNDREEQPHNTHTDRALRQPENSPAVGAGDEAFSRASTPSLPRSHSTSSLYHEFSSAGVSPSPPPGLRTGSRLSRNHSWVSSPFSSQAWQRPADTAWPLEYLSVDPAPPVDGDQYPSRMDPRELVIELLMDQLKRTSLRSGRSPQFPAHSSSHLRSPSVPDERLNPMDPGMVRHLVSGDPNATVVARPEQGVQGRRPYRSDIDLMRQALDLIEMERFPHRFRSEVPDNEPPEVYVSGQYRPPIVDQGRETPPQPPALRTSAGTHSRSQLNASLRQVSVPSAALPPQPSGPHRSGHHAGVAHNTTSPPPGMESQSGGTGPGAREGLYRYFVHSNSPIHTPSWTTPQDTPAGTPSQRHLLHRYLTQSHVEAELRGERVQSAETRSLRRPPPSVARDRLSSTLPAGLALRTQQVADNPHTALPTQGRRMPGGLPGGFIPQANRASDNHPHHPNPHADRVVRNVHPYADRVVPNVHPHSTTTRASGFVPHTLIPRASRPADVQCYTERLEVVTPDAVATPDNPDSGMHSGTHSAASRRHPLQSLDNSPSLSPTSLTQQPVHTKPTPHTQGTVGSDRHKHPYSEGRRGSGQAPQVTVHPGSPRHSSRSRSHSQGHRQSTERSGDRNHHAASLGYVPDSSASGQAKSVDCLR